MKATDDDGSGCLILRNDQLRIELSLTGGTYSLIDGASGRSVLRDAVARAELTDGATVSTAGGPLEVQRAPHRFEDAHGNGVRVELRTGAVDGLALRWEIALYDAQPFALMRLGLENDGRAPRGVHRLVPLAIGGLKGNVCLQAPPRRWRFFRHGWQSWTPSLTLSGAQEDIDARPPMLAPVEPPAGRGRFGSDGVAALLDPTTGSVIVAGFVSAHRHWTRVALDAGRHSLEALAYADGAPVSPNSTLWSERLLLCTTGDPQSALGRYAVALAAEMGARVPPAPPTGWCSWYHYYRDVTEADVLENLRALERLRDRLPLSFVQIDDGYQANIGDWTETNDGFPHSMAWLADRIHAAGFQAGLWLAPFLIGESSTLYARHPDWVVRDDAGAPVVAARNWDQACYGLDGTHPDAEAWLRDLFQAIASGWGYDYVKVDFLYGAALAGRRHDAGSTRIEAYRRALCAVREGVGDRFVLGCGAVMDASVGLVDAQRIGPDVAPWWRWDRPLDPPRHRRRPRANGQPSVENALRNVLTRSWMHGRVWANDPDCLLARDIRTKLTLPEVQSLATAIALTGGMTVLSDDLTRLSAARLDLVSMLLPPLDVVGEVQDLMEREMPSRVALELTLPFESWWLLAAFNHAGRRRDLAVELPQGSWHAFELWGGRYHDMHEESLVVPGVRPHGVALIAARRPVNVPQVLATSLHVSMGGREIAHTAYDTRHNALHVDLTPVARKEGELFVHAPEGFRAVAARLGEDDLRVRQDGRLATVPVSLRAPATLSIEFSVEGMCS